MCICSSLGIFNLCPVFVCNKCFGRILLEQFIASAATICAVGQIFNLRKQIISCREGAGGGLPWATQASLRVHMVHRACRLQLGGFWKHVGLNKECDLN